MLLIIGGAELQRSGTSHDTHTNYYFYGVSQMLVALLVFGFAVSCFHPGYCLNLIS